jgi:DNA end-binding protein Ku
MKIVRLLPLVVGAGLGTALGGLSSRYSKGEKPADSLDELTKAELYERARAAGIPGRSEMTKDELIRALRSTG